MVCYYEMLVDSNDVSFKLFDYIYFGKYRSYQKNELKYF
jgi:hypothetical protein